MRYTYENQEWKPSLGHSERPEHLWRDLIGGKRQPQPLDSLRPIQSQSTKRPESPNPTKKDTIWGVPLEKVMRSLPPNVREEIEAILNNLKKRGGEQL